MVLFAEGSRSLDGKLKPFKVTTTIIIIIIIIILTIITTTTERSISNGKNSGSSHRTN